MSITRGPIFATLDGAKAFALGTVSKWGGRLNVYRLAHGAGFQTGRHKLDVGPLGSVLVASAYSPNAWVLRWLEGYDILETWDDPTEPALPVGAGL